MKPSARVLQFASFSFDASVWEYGNRAGEWSEIVVAGEGGMAEPAGLVEAAEERGISISVPPTVGGLRDR